jgi:hypothetical protein
MRQETKSNANFLWNSYLPFACDLHGKTPTSKCKDCALGAQLAIGDLVIFPSDLPSQSPLHRACTECED